MSTEPVVTPYVRSTAVSALCGKDVWLKIDAMQASGSFKDRGMLRLCSELKKRGAKKIVSSSGGNAGLAAAHCGRVLGLSVEVVVPETTKAMMKEKISAQGAQVDTVGVNWNAADEEARRRVAADTEGTTHYAHPFDDPLLWEGHSSIIDEIVDAGPVPDAIVACAGGAGLVCGIYHGLRRRGLTDCAVVVAETDGADSFSQTFKSGELVTLPAITSVATSLGALRVTEEAHRLSREHKTVSVVVTDKEAVDACLAFADDHRLLVEPACGAALAVCYSERHRDVLKPFSRVAVVVCGGSGVTYQMLTKWQAELK